jgi:hypothetical protein
MRCFLMKMGHIRAVEVLEPAPDQALVDQARGHFRRRAREKFDDFEVWVGTRRLYSLSEDPTPPDAHPAGAG